MKSGVCSLKLYNFFLAKFSICMPLVGFEPTASGLTSAGALAAELERW